MCGIFGVSGKKGRAINLYKLKILGLYNESRGTDGCGYYFNGNIDKGIHLESDFSKFVIKNKLEPGELKTMIFMGHTRKKTHGSLDFEGTHPHLVDDNYVQTHNGIIKNIWSMCNTRQINHSKIHVDSIGLAQLISKFGPKPILEEYKGSAALAFTYMNNPEVLCLYHGKSKETKTGVAIEERPLFILRQPEGMYYSSMSDALWAINSHPETFTPFILKHNEVYELQNGEFTDNSIPIEREENNIEEYANFSTGYSGYGSNYNRGANIRTALQRVIPFEEEDNDDDMITKELMPELNQSMIDTVFYNSGKYYKVSASTLGNAYAMPIHGEFIITRDGVIINKSLKSELDSREHKYCFINGVMIKSKEMYDRFVKECINGYNETTFKQLSVGSRYPIIQLKNTTTKIGKTLWYQGGHKVKRQTFKPKFSTKSYKIRQGKTKQINDHTYYPRIVQASESSNTQAKTAQTAI